MKLHLDEDADAHALLIALRHRGIDVTSSRELALLGSSDEAQLSWAVQHDRVLYTYNACDFCKLHAEVLRAGEHHPGIIIGDQQTMSIGQELRRLLRINEAIPAAEMVDRLEFISNWAP
jgi:hypothetical protein